MGVVPPTQAEFDAAGIPIVNNPTEGTVVVDFPPDVVEPEIVIMTDQPFIAISYVTEGGYPIAEQEEPTGDTPKKQEKKKRIHTRSQHE